jgi:hypothetical protein
MAQKLLRQSNEITFATIIPLSRAKSECCPK